MIMNEALTVVGWKMIQGQYADDFYRDSCYKLIFMLVMTCICPPKKYPYWQEELSLKSCCFSRRMVFIRFVSFFVFSLLAVISIFFFKFFFLNLKKKFFFVGHIHMSYFGATGTPVL